MFYLLPHYDGDECFGIIVFEQALKLATDTIHLRHFLFSKEHPGLSTKIGPLKQNIVTMEKYRLEDPDIEHFEIITK